MEVFLILRDVFSPQEQRSMHMWLENKSCDVLHSGLYYIASLVSVCSCWSTWEGWSMKPWTGESTAKWNDNWAILWRNCCASCWSWMTGQQNYQSPCRMLSRFPSSLLVNIAALEELMEQRCWPRGKTISGEKLGGLLKDREGTLAFPSEGKGKTKVFVSTHGK